MFVAAFSPFNVYVLSIVTVLPRATRYIMRKGDITWRNGDVKFISTQVKRAYANMRKYQQDSQDFKILTVLVGTIVQTNVDDAVDYNH